MTAQRNLSRPKLPAKKPSLNKRDDLLNNVIDFLEEQGLFWKGDADTSGRKFV